MEKDRTGKSINNSRIPLVIGVTGHRDIVEEDLRRAKEAVRGQIRELSAAFPNTPVVMLSSLAKGADQICAQVATEEGIELIAVLPMPLEEYEKDFEGKDLSELKRLAGLAGSVFVTPFEEPERDGRDFLYRQAGICVARHSHVLIALWDGTEPVRGGCGTNEIVDIMLHGNTSVLRDEGFTADKGCVIHIPVRREGSNTEAAHETGNKGADKTGKKNGITGANNDGRGEKAGNLKTEFLGDKKVFLEIIKKTEEFNRDSMRTARKKQKNKTKKGENPTRKEAGTARNISEEENRSGNAHDKKRLHAVYRAADELSIKEARAYRKSIAFIALMAMLLTMSFLLYDEANMHYLIIFCGVVIGGIYAINIADRKIGFHRKYLEYRVLAEGLRVQRVLDRAGTGAQAFDMFPWSVQTDLPWIVRALAVLNLKTEKGKGDLGGYKTTADVPGTIFGNYERDNTNVNTAGETADTVTQKSYREWIREQKEYHEAVVKTASVKANRNNRIVKTAIGITIFVYAAALLFEIFAAGLFSGRALLNPEDAEFVRTIIKIVLGSLSAASLFAGSYYGKLSLDERADDSRRMAALYGEALEREETGLDKDKLCRMLAREELSENARWFAYKSLNGTDAPIN